MLFSLLMIQNSHLHVLSYYVLTPSPNNLSSKLRQSTPNRYVEWTFFYLLNTGKAIQPEIALSNLSSIAIRGRSTSPISSTVFLQCVKESDGLRGTSLFSWLMTHWRNLQFKGRYWSVSQSAWAVSLNFSTSRRWNHDHTHDGEWLQRKAPLWWS